jgi:putative peptidoglycan lipid II flippase
MRDVLSRTQEEAQEHRAERIVRNTGIVAGFLLLGRILGLARELIANRYMGTRWEADAYRLANDTMLQDIYAKFEKLLQPVYVPIFVARQRQDGDPEAWRFTSTVGTVQFLLLVILCVCGVIWAPQLVAGLATLLGEERMSEHPELYRLTISFLRILLPALVVYSLSNLAELTIQTYHSFTIPALAEAARRVLIVAGLVAVIVVFRGGANAVQVTQGLVIGSVVGCAARLLVQLPLLRGRLKLLRPRLELGNPDVRKAGILALPLIVGIVFSYIRNLAETLFAIRVSEGSLAALRAARKLVDMPWQVLGLGISYVIYPFISELGAKQERGEMADALVSMIRVMAFIFVPMTIFMFILAEPTIITAFYGLRFDAESVRLTMQAMPWYVLGMLFFGIEDPMLKWFFALSDTKTPIIMGIVGDLIWFGIAVPGIKFYGAGLMALALAMTLSKMLKVLILLAILRPRLGPVPRERVLPFVGKLLVAVAVMTVAILLASRFLEATIPFTGWLKGAAEFCGSAAVAVIVYVAASFALRIEELQLVVDRMKARLRRGSA